MFGRDGAPNNACPVHEHFIVVDDRVAARCTQRLAALEFSSCTRAGARIARVVSCGETCIHRGSIVFNQLRLWVDVHEVAHFFFSSPRHTCRGSTS
jgi:hypothetical protein